MPSYGVLPTWEYWCETAQRSRNPEMWKDLLFAYPTSMGNTGGILRDATGRYQNLTLNGGLALGRDGAYPYGTWALDFDASNDNATSTGTFECDGPCTFAAWFKHDTNQSEAVLIICGSGITTSDFLLHQGWATELKWGWSSYTIGGGTAQGTGWHHVVGVRDGSSGSWTGLLYIDGHLQASSTTATNPNASGSTITLGSLPGSTNWWSGRLADPILWGRAFNANEVWALYQGHLEWLLPARYHNRNYNPPAAAGNKLLLRLMQEGLFQRAAA